MIDYIHFSYQVDEYFSNIEGEFVLPKTTTKKSSSDDASNQHPTAVQFQNRKNNAKIYSKQNKVTELFSLQHDCNVVVADTFRSSSIAEC